MVDPQALARVKPSVAVVHTLIMIIVIGSVNCRSTTILNVGAIFTFDSVIGRAAKIAMEAAVSDINADPTVLPGKKLNLIMENANCSAFMGSMAAFQVLEKELVAIIGPQSSAIAHILAQTSDGLQVPLISYAATDPTLSALQFPFFIRASQSDAVQMSAVADLIDFYGWKEVIVVYLDDDYGRNGVSGLADELEKRKLKAAYKLPLRVQFDVDEITRVLNYSKVFGPRVYVVHVNPDPRLRIFSVAQKLQMMTTNYVWFATDWLSTTLDSFLTINQTSTKPIQGVVGLRQHTPDSRLKRDFVSRWVEMQHKGATRSGLNSYGLQAYDTVWTVARSVDKYIEVYGNITFSSDSSLLKSKASVILLNKLKTFNGGSSLVNIMLQSNFTGVSGQVQFSTDRNIVSGGYDIINIKETGISMIGYWSNRTGFSIVPPETLEGKTDFSQKQRLGNVTWPGGKTERPRGWDFANSERPLRIGVPKRESFVEFVTERNDSHKIQGYCIDVFLAALRSIPYEVPYTFEIFGDGKSNPHYDMLVKMVAENVFDAAVGDITIVTKRMKMVDFSQPYASTGLVIVAPVDRQKSSAWVFLKPFSAGMWCMTGASFFLIGVVISILEHRVNDDFRGPPKRQFLTMLLFTFSTLFKTNQENTISPLGRMVMVVWLFALMVITSSYTASLTSFLTVQQLSSTITGLESLIVNDWPIGYQVGSFANSYMTESLNIHKSRLIPLGSPEEYEWALRQGPTNGGVAAIVDELPYVELFLSMHTDFAIVGQTFTKGGWGFAFQRDSPLSTDMSTAILKLSENGELQKIHDKWFCKMDCPGERTPDNEPDQLTLTSFWGLYLLCAIVTATALVIFLARTSCQFAKHQKRQEESLQSPSPEPSSSCRCSHLIQSFMDFVDQKEEAIKKMFTPSDHPLGEQMS